MAKLTVPHFNKWEREIFEKRNIELIEDLKAEDFEKEIERFLKEHNVLHLATCKNNEARSTPLEYWGNGLKVHIMSEGGGKIGNIRANPKVAYSIAEPYFPKKEFFGAVGLQVWGMASMFKKNDDMEKFKEIYSHSHYAKTPEALRNQDVSQVSEWLNFNIITIEPLKIRYLNVKNGYRNVMWKKEG